jgi:hypothetical protein
MNADAKLDALVRCDARVAIDHSALDLDPAAHSVDHATELNDTPVAGAFDDPAVVEGDCGIDEIAAQRPEPRHDALFVCSREPAVTDHVRDQYRRYFPGLAHGAPLFLRFSLAQKPVPNCPISIWRHPAHTEAEAGGHYWSQETLRRTGFYSHVAPKRCRLAP